MTIGRRARPPTHCLAWLSGWVFAPCSAQELTIHTWIDSFPDSIVEQFEKKSGYTLEFSYFYSDLERDTNLSDVGVEYDIVMTDAYTLPSFSTARLFQPINPADFPNFKHLDPYWAGSCGRLGVPHFWGGVGIAYRSTQVTQPVDSWEDLLAPEVGLHGRINMLNETFDLLVPALKLIGASANSIDMTELKQAYQLLLKQRPYVRTYNSTPSIPNATSPQSDDKSLAMAHVYSGFQQTYIELTGQQDWKFVYPKEGTTLWMDCLSINRKSKHASVAREFLDFLLDPEIAAQLAEDVWEATPNLSARKFLSDEYLTDPAIFIRQSILDKSEPELPRTFEAQAIRTKILISLEK